MKCVKKDDIYVYVKSNRMYFTIGNVEYEWIGDTNHAFYKPGKYRARPCTYDW